MQFDFTRDELFEFFGDQYAQQQVEQALITLHERHDNSIDPKAEGYPASITSLLERVFKEAEETVAATKQLGGANLATVGQVAAIAPTTEQLDISLDAMQGIIAIVDAEAAVEAYALYERRKAVRDGVLTQLEINDLAEANEQAAKRMTALQKLCKDPDVLDQILADYNLLPQNEATKQHLELTASCSLDFNPEAFLSEVNPEKKQRPKTVADTKNLAKFLLSRK